MGMQKQDYIIIGARPSQGKTALALTMINAACKAGKSVGFFSAEMGILSILRRLASLEGSIEADKMRSGWFTPTDFASLRNVCDYLNEAKLYINETPNISLRALVSEAQKMKRNENIDIIFLDYISLVKNNSSKPRHEQIAEISVEMKGLARSLDIPIVVLSQLRREAQGQKPQLNDLRESGQIEQDADLVCLLHNEGIHNGNPDILKYQLLVEKARNYATKTIDMLFYKKYTRFIELEAN
jgi:replicative DNA helicase